MAKMSVIIAQLTWLSVWEAIHNKCKVTLYFWYCLSNDLSS